MISDEEIIAQYLADSISFDVLVERHRQELLNFIYFKYTHNWSVAEDIVQESFLRAYLKLSQFDQNKKFKTWLYKIAINRAHTHFANHEANFVLEDFDMVSTSDPSEFAERSLQADSVRRILLTLPKEKSLIIELHYQQGYEINEIAQKLKKPAYVIKSKLRSAEKDLARLYCQGEY